MIESLLFLCEARAITWPQLKASLVSNYAIERTERVCSSRSKKVDLYDFFSVKEEISYAVNRVGSF
jgi:hypothetical protein